MHFAQVRHDVWQCMWRGEPPYYDPVFILGKVVYIKQEKQSYKRPSLWLPKHTIRRSRLGICLKLFHAVLDHGWWDRFMNRAKYFDILFLFCHPIFHSLDHTYFSRILLICCYVLNLFSGTSLTCSLPSKNLLSANNQGSPQLPICCLQFLK